MPKSILLFAPGLGVLVLIRTIGKSRGFYRHYYSSGAVLEKMLFGACSLAARQPVKLLLFLKQRVGISDAN